MVSNKVDDFPSMDELLKANQKQIGKIPAIKFLKKFKRFEVVKGSKGKNPKMDNILKYRGSAIPMDELAMICAFMYWNDDSNYPRQWGYEGGEKFRKFINEAMTVGFPTRESVEKHKLPLLK